MRDLRQEVSRESSGRGCAGNGEGFSGENQGYNINLNVIPLSVTRIQLI